MKSTLERYGFVDSANKESSILSFIHDEDYVGNLNDEGFGRDKLYLMGIDSFWSKHDIINHVSFNNVSKVNMYREEGTQNSTLDFYLNPVEGENATINFELPISTTAFNKGDTVKVTSYLSTIPKDKQEDSLGDVFFTLTGGLTSLEQTIPEKSTEYEKTLELVVTDTNYEASPFLTLTVPGKFRKVDFYTLKVQLTFLDWEMLENQIPYFE